MAWANLREDVASEFDDLVVFDRRYAEGQRAWRYGGTSGFVRPDGESDAQMKARHQREHMARQYANGLPRGGKSGRAAKLELTPEVIETVKASPNAIELAKTLGRSRALAYRLRKLLLS